MTKRGSDDVAGGLSKKAHTDDDSELIVYQPSIVPPELKGRINSLVEVLLPARYLVADHKQVRQRARARLAIRTASPAKPAG